TIPSSGSTTTVPFAVNDNQFAVDNNKSWTSSNATGTANLGANTQLGNVYYIATPDIVKSATIAFSTVTSLEFTISIYAVSAGNGLTKVYTSQKFNRNIANAQYSLTEFVFAEQQLLQPGYYFFTADQLTSEALNVVSDKEANCIFRVSADGTMLEEICGSVSPITGQLSMIGNLALRVNLASHVAVTPKRNAKNVPVNAPVTVEFMRNRTLVNAPAITITPNPGGVVPSVTGNKLTIAHNAFAYNTTYTVTVNANSVSELWEGITWSFTTQPDPTQCNTPLNPSVSGLTYTSALLSWEETGIATSWEIKYGAPGFDPTSTAGTWMHVTTKPYRLNGLTNNTTYDYYVRAVCPEGGTTAWSDKVTFTTPIDCENHALPIFEDMEDGMPRCWTVVDANNDGITWKVEKNTSSPYGYNSSPSSLRYSGYMGQPTSNVVADDWMFSPVIHMEQGRIYKIRFWYKKTGSMGTDKLAVYVSDGKTKAAAQASADNKLWSVEGTAITTAWKQQELSVTGKDGDFYFALHSYSAQTTYYLAVDNIEIEEIANRDAGVTAILSPVNGHDLTAAETVQVKVKNFGASELPSIPVTFSLDSGTAIPNETVPGPIASGQEVTYTFSTKADLSAGGVHTIKASTKLSRDENDKNDSYTIAVENRVCPIKSIPYGEGFDYNSNSILPNECWMVINMPSSTGWNVQTTNDTPSGGGKRARHRYTDGSDSWLITSAIAIPASGATLQFESKIGEPGEYGSGKSSVLVTTNANREKSNFTEIWTPSSAQITDSWTPVAVNLNAYAGQTIFIAFRYQGDGWAHDWFIDDILVDNLDPITLVNTNIKHGDVEVDPRDNFIATFSKDITERSFNNITMTGGGNEIVVTPSISGNKLTLSHDVLEAQTTYTISIPATVIRNFSSPINITYTTGEGTGITNPSLFSPVYPTVTKGDLTVNTSGEATVKIQDLSGRTLAKYASNGVLNLRLNFANGIYLVVIENEKSVSTHKVILQK
ncbi:MAG: choice-of-anchor J domain-containing protein, partial [Dysgonamonadaceae bacterium]|nr:choice-of-anchor J domain-containing protein [Dysgonamonadaceae bacterium]